MDNIIIEKTETVVVRETIINIDEIREIIDWNIIDIEILNSEIQFWNQILEYMGWYATAIQEWINHNMELVENFKIYNEENQHYLDSNPE